MSTSWATSAVPSPSVTSRASARRSSSPATSSGDTPSGASSSIRTRRRVAAVSSPRSVSRTNMPRASSRRPAAISSSSSSAVCATAAANSAALTVALDGQRAPVSALPGGAQRVGEQRQRAGFPGHLADHQLDQPGFEPQPGQAARAPPPPARARRRSSLPSRSWLAETARASVGVGAEAPVHVGPQPDHHRTAGGQQRVDVGQPPVGVVAQGEELLELINDDELAGVVAGVEVGMGPGRAAAARARCP